MIWKMLKWSVLFSNSRMVLDDLNECYVDMSKWYNHYAFLVSSTLSNLVDVF